MKRQKVKLITSDDTAVPPAEAIRYALQVNGGTISVSFVEHLDFFLLQYFDDEDKLAYSLKLTPDRFVHLMKEVPLDYAYAVPTKELKMKPFPWSK